jgi:hypothetical protein
LGVFELSRKTSKNAIKKIRKKNDMEISHFFGKTFSTGSFAKGFLVLLNSVLAEKRLKMQLKRQVGGGEIKVGGCFLDGFCTCTWAFVFILFYREFPAAGVLLFIDGASVSATLSSASAAIARPRSGLWPAVGYPQSSFFSLLCTPVVLIRVLGFPNLTAPTSPPFTPSPFSPAFHPPLPLMAALLSSHCP